MCSRLKLLKWRVEQKAHVGSAIDVNQNLLDELTIYPGQSVDLSPYVSNTKGSDGAFEFGGTGVTGTTFTAPEVTDYTQYTLSVIQGASADGTYCAIDNPVDFSISVTPRIPVEIQGPTGGLFAVNQGLEIVTAINGEYQNIPGTWSVPDGATFNHEVNANGLLITGQTDGGPYTITFTPGDTHMYQTATYDVTVISTKLPAVSFGTQPASTAYCGNQNIEPLEFGFDFPDMEGYSFNFSWTRDGTDNVSAKDNITDLAEARYTPDADGTHTYTCTVTVHRAIKNRVGEVYITLSADPITTDIATVAMLAEPDAADALVLTSNKTTMYTTGTATVSAQTGVQGGAVTYSITPATGYTWTANDDGTHSFSATVPATYTITATQAATNVYCEQTASVSIEVKEAGGSETCYTFSAGVSNADSIDMTGFVLYATGDAAYYKSGTAISTASNGDAVNKCGVSASAQITRLLLHLRSAASKIKIEGYAGNARSVSSIYTSNTLATEKNAENGFTQLTSGTDYTSTSSEASTCSSVEVTGLNLQAGQYVIISLNGAMHIARICVTSGSSTALPEFSLTTTGATAVCAGQEATGYGTMTVSLTNEDELGSVSYAWYEQGGATVLGTEASYTPTAAGSYYCVVTNTDTETNQTAEATSNTVAFSVSNGPGISGLPTTVSMMAGKTREFTATTSGATSHQWYKDGVAISGATTRSYSYNATTADAGEVVLTLRAGNDCGTTEASITINVIDPSTICGQLIKYTLNGTNNSAISIAAGEGGILGGTADVSMQTTQMTYGSQTGYKLGKNGQYVGLALPDDYDGFRSGDILYAYVTRESGGTVAEYLEAYGGRSTAELNETAMRTQYMRVGLNHVRVTRSEPALYLYRKSVEMNPVLSYLEVVRPCQDNATLLELAIGGTYLTEVDPDVTNYQFYVPSAVESLQESDFTVVPTYYNSAEDRATWTVAAPSSIPGVAVITITSKDGTQSRTYKVNINHFDVCGDDFTSYTLAAKQNEAGTLTGTEDEAIGVNDIVYVKGLDPDAGHAGYYKLTGGKDSTSTTFNKAYFGIELAEGRGFFGQGDSLAIKLIAYGPKLMLYSNENTVPFVTIDLPDYVSGKEYDFTYFLTSAIPMGTRRLSVRNFNGSQTHAVKSMEVSRRCIWQAELLDFKINGYSTIIEGTDVRAVMPEQNQLYKQLPYTFRVSRAAWVEIKDENGTTVYKTKSVREGSEYVVSLDGDFDSKFQFAANNGEFGETLSHKLTMKITSGDGAKNNTYRITPGRKYRICYLYNTAKPVRTGDFVYAVFDDYFGDGNATNYVATEEVAGFSGQDAIEKGDSIARWYDMIVMPIDMNADNAVYQRIGDGHLSGQTRVLNFQYNLLNGGGGDWNVASSTASGSTAGIDLTSEEHAIEAPIFKNLEAQFAGKTLTLGAKVYGVALTNAQESSGQVNGGATVTINRGWQSGNTQYSAFVEVPNTGYHKVITAAVDFRDFNGQTPSYLRPAASQRAPRRAPAAAASSKDISSTIVWNLIDYSMGSSTFNAASGTATGLEETEYGRHTESGHLSQLEGIALEGHMLRNLNGQPLCVFSVSGQMLSLTRSDVDLSRLPQGMYIIRGTSGYVKVIR